MKLISVLACAALLGCGWFGDVATKLVILILDVSGTVPLADSVLYRESARHIADSLQSGDRLVLVKLGGQSVATAQIYTDFTLQRTNVVRRDRLARDSVIRLIDSAVARLAGERSADTSNVLDAFSFAASIIANDTRPHRFIVMHSDMLHETKELNLRTGRIDSTAIANVIASRRLAGALPDLTAIRISVVGAGGAQIDDARYYTVRQFWSTFLSATGAALDAYGRVPVTIPKR